MTGSARMPLDIAKTSSTLVMSVAAAAADEAAYWDGYLMGFGSFSLGSFDGVPPWLITRSSGRRCCWIFPPPVLSLMNFCRIARMLVCFCQGFTRSGST